ncbi:NAD(+) synthase [Limnoglobus roseus]|uniref:Glutamine-dependent NAD(+) synthetase n=1 Tax=Limnoglobus roseus TaxID=2598579 RepID=A0A5C1AQJ4_9BACT|nr:NAD(+) synthase [Limnoglobus roseus]QEL20012.1 NAD(+) synthase [Limnoglobus roseus]
MTPSFLRVAAGVPELRVADPKFNAERTLDLLREAEEKQVRLIVFPECGLTGYTCHDLFHQPTLLAATEAALETLLSAADLCYSGVGVVGLPVVLDGMVFNCAAVFRSGKLLGVVPKSYLPNYKEFYDARYFAPARNALSNTIRLAGQSAPFGTDILFESETDAGFVLGVEICEDLWMPVSPSSLQAVNGATVLVNLSASNETIGKSWYRRQLVASQSSKCLAGYVYTSSGVGESTTDLVFGGHAMVGELGNILAESKRFQRANSLTVADLDLQRIEHDRMIGNSVNDLHADPELKRTFRRVKFQTPASAFPTKLERFIDPHPFVPSDPFTLRERCEEIFLTQVAGLSKRLEHIGKPAVSIGVSGGLDSTLALLVLCKTFDDLGVPREKIRALTMPGFGTTGRTKGNAHVLMKTLGLSAREVDIRQLCFDEMKALSHAPFGIPLEHETLDTLSGKLRNLHADARNDLTFENVQARARTNLLMNTAFVIGTGDLSELALGWCTYNADHISMYNPNVSIPKTLVKFLVRWAAENEFDGEVRSTLLDVVETEISPELLPTAADGGAGQSTEGTIGPYELHDFFLYHFLRWGSPPEKILALARQAKFDRYYSPADLRKWLTMFLKRFFTNQFKRSCLPDGPKVGSVSLSPRGDWRMPSDAVARAWLEAVERAP